MDDPCQKRKSALPAPCRYAMPVSSLVPDASEMPCNAARCFRNLNCGNTFSKTGCVALYHVVVTLFSSLLLCSALPCFAGSPCMRDQPADQIKPIQYCFSAASARAFRLATRQAVIVACSCTDDSLRNRHRRVFSCSIHAKFEVARETSKALAKPFHLLRLAD